MSLVDLHLHSSVSDGRHAPETIVRMAAELGLKYIALTDHDSVDGLVPALEEAKKHSGLTLIPGVEISTDLPDGEAHILGYFIDFTDRALRDSLRRFRDSRVNRAQTMIKKLGALGIDIDWQRVKEIAGDGSIGRPHLARAMLEKGYITSFEEAFDKYIGHGGPAYAEREKMTPSEAVALVVRSGGLPVLAHPFTVPDPAAMVAELKKAGLVGIEAYYKDNSGQNTEEMLALAAKYDLLATGGSDYHGIENDSDAMLGSVEVPLEAAERLVKMAAARGGELAGL